MSSKNHVVEFDRVVDHAMFFKVWEYSRPQVQATFVVSIDELTHAKDPSVIMDARSRTALEQVRNR